MSDQFFTPCPSNENCNYSPIVGKPQKFRKDFLLAVINVNATGVVLTVYTSPDLRCLLVTKQDVELVSPQQGWFEQDPEEIIEAIYKCTSEVCQMLHTYDFVQSDIKAVAITTQRETAVVWSSRSGKSLYKAIAANDIRAITIAEKITTSLKQDQNYFKSIAGLPIIPDCLALKLLWMQENVHAVEEAIKDGSCRAGTMDSWIIWNLTMGSLHITDVTNASRTLLMNLYTLEWDTKLLKIFNIDYKILPTIRNCAETFGSITSPSCPLRNAKISAIISDQSAALLGQMCMYPCQINAYFDNSCCLLCNTGKKCIISKELLTTVAYKFDDKTSCIYALEGNVPACGKLLDWLQFKLRLLPNRNEAEHFASSVHTTGNVFFVPAFSGLQAPFWRTDARGIIIGLTDNTTKLHLVRAAFESICFQNYDIIRTMRQIYESEQDVIFVSGSLASNEMLMQMQADIAGISIVKYNVIDAVSYGAAMCAGRAIGTVDMRRFEHGIWRHSIDFETFAPRKRSDHRIVRYVKWRRAVGRSINWIEKHKEKVVFPFFQYISTGAVAIITILMLKTAFK